MVCEGTRDDNSFCFYTLNRPGASLSEPELQYFAENCGVSEIFALRRQLWGTGTAPWESSMTSVFPHCWARCRILPQCPRWLSPALHLRAFFRGASCSTAALKRSAKTAASGWSSCPVVCWTHRAPTGVSTQCRHECQHGTLKACATRASFEQTVKSAPCPHYNRSLGFDIVCSWSGEIASSSTRRCSAANRSFVEPESPSSLW